MLLLNSNEFTEKHYSVINIKKEKRCVFDNESREESIKEVNNENETNKLLMVLIEQTKELKEKLERLENKLLSDTLQISSATNNTYNIYLNENKNLYKIFDKSGIENKIAKLVEICNDKN